jgi:hypothetical protein
MAVTKTKEIPYMRRYDFKKADWNNFIKDLDSMIAKIEPTNDNNDKFIDQVKRISRQNIPRGCHTHYIPSLTPEPADSLHKYI